MKITKINKVVWVLSLVSLFTDMASEMLYPVMPLYLESIGFTVLTIGILEGFAEAIVGLSKGYFGQLSDVKKSRTPFVKWGYGLSALSKPMIIFFSYPIWIFVCRTIDRLGKGLRTGARDALLSEQTTNENKARIFGFHRSMDTMGAVIGPAIALIFLFYFPKNYRPLFLISFIPSIIAIFLTLKLKSEKQNINVSDKKIKINFYSYFGYWKKSNQNYKKLVISLLIFVLANSSDVFLLLQTKSIGYNDIQVILFYILYNIIYAICAYPIGIMADKLGIKKVYIIGLVIFSIVYLGFGVMDKNWIWLLYILYGIYAACTEGVSRAWISNICKKDETATAIGTFSSLQSIMALASSSIAGYIWYEYGANYMFMFSAILSFIVAIYLMIDYKIYKNKL